MKRPLRVIPINIRPLDDGLADAQGFKQFLLVIGDGGLRPVIRFHVDVSDSGGAAEVKFKVVQRKK